MVYTEIQERNGKKYYYRVHSVRVGKKVRKKRKYLGVDLENKELKKKEQEADRELPLLNTLLIKEEIDFLGSVKKKFSKEAKEGYKNRYESFVSLFTYDSTTIEGNTLTLRETAGVLFENLVPAKKSMREIYEVQNHKKAFDYMLNYKEDITKDFICELHKLVVANTLSEELTQKIGKYRNIQVFIRGASIIPSKPQEVHQKMTALLSWYTKNKKKIHPLIVAAYFHVEFEKIHPFVDGNGRVGRLLLNFILHKNKFPMVNIPNKKKLKYYELLEKAQIKEEYRDFVLFLLNLIKGGEIRF